MNKLVRIVNLKTEYMVCPIGMDEKNPAFSWQMEAKHYGAAQSAYQIVVWKEDIIEDIVRKTIVWDSKKVLSKQSVAVLYQGTMLSPKKRYYWDVTVWDEQGAAKKK